jgi:CBS domain-containing protein
MSPRAAVRLEQLGFAAVYDYAGGKSDWLAAGLPREGEAAMRTFAGDIAENPPVCAPDDPVSFALERMEQAGNEHCIVVDARRIVLGRLDRADVEPGHRFVEEAMRRGSSTVRASEPIEPLLERMRKAGRDAIPITDPDGRLLGLLRLEAAERALHALGRVAKSAA